MRIAVFGARGQLGAAVVEECSAAHDVIAFARGDLEMTDADAAAGAVERARADAVVNAVAYTDVDGSEDHPVDALDANAFVVRALARAAERQGAAFVHYSSDFVFDGAATTPYTEDERPNPRSVYATSKLLGEWFAVDTPQAYVLRVESLFGRASGGPPSRGSVASIVNTLRSGGRPKVFEDRTVSPTYIPDAARATRLLLETRPQPGIYHCVSTGSCTWLEFARALAAGLGGDAMASALVPVKMADVPLRAARPQFCALSNDKLRAAGIEMPSWQDALARFLQTLRDEVADKPADRKA